MSLQFNDAMADNTNLEDTPVASAPPGTMTDFAGNPGNQCGILIGFASVFMAAMLLSGGIRFYTKLRISRRWRSDDVTFTIGFLGTIGVFILTMMLGIVSRVGSHVWNVPLGLIYSTIWVSENDCYDTLVPLTMGFLKITFFLYLYHTFSSYRSIRLSAITGKPFRH